MSVKRLVPSAGRVVLLAGFAALAGQYGHAASDTGAATATVITPITINNTVDLAFGRFSANTGGSITVSTGGVRSKTGTLAFSTIGNVTTAASFDIGGASNATYTVTLPSTDVTITETVGGTATMIVNTFVSAPSGTAGTLSTGSGGVGAETLLVGATLTVGSGQTPGDYTGTFSVAVEYN